MGALWKLALQLCREDFTHFYDAHNHPRSRFLGMILFFHALFFKFRWLHRLCRPRRVFKRFLGLKLHIGTYKKEPFRPRLEMLKPLKKWGPLAPELTESTDGTYGIDGRNQRNLFSQRTSFLPKYRKGWKAFCEKRAFPPLL